MIPKIVNDSSFSRRKETREEIDVSSEGKLFMGLTVVMQLVIALILSAAGVEVTLQWGSAPEVAAYLIQLPSNQLVCLTHSDLITYTGVVLIRTIVFHTLGSIEIDKIFRLLYLGFSWWTQMTHSADHLSA